MRQVVLALAGSLLLAGCVTPGYRLVEPGSVGVGRGTLTVRPGVAWNKSPGGSPQHEVWTRNGPLLDTLTFIVGVPDGGAITRQKPGADRQVPAFHTSMSPDDLLAMIESYYRIRVEAKVFTTTRVAPRTFLGGAGMQVDYDYVLDDEVRRRGCAVVDVHHGKLYLVMLDGTALHYFDGLKAEFLGIVSSAAAD
jgi:hypothetical protein